MDMLLIYVFLNRANSVPHFATQGFELRRADESNDASDVARVFRQAKLEGKQLWYFTAPSSVPITVVEKLAIPVEQAEQGKAILNHEDEDYGMSFDDALTSKTIKLLIPNKAGDKYSIRMFPFPELCHSCNYCMLTSLSGPDYRQDYASEACDPVFTGWRRCGRCGCWSGRPGTGRNKEAGQEAARRPARTLPADWRQRHRELV